MNKVQLTLTDQEVDILTGYGDQFGYSLPKTIRFIVGKAAEKFLKEASLPVFQMSDKTEELGLQAQKEFKAGKTILVDDVDDVDDFFDKIS
jgi:hypothetical protein